ncbi:DUF4328 domain-containing protein [Cohnella suwonensis]|uniref:DUF4328 domain-containing protein n=1 Tax=Cohnella suwonensis TaxID=696072 RepID=A0ABW0LNF8_9BACL
MKLYSELTSNILKLMLIALIVVAAVRMLATLVYVIDMDAYWDYAYNADNFARIVRIVLFIINLIVFLVWIYRVHVDMKSLYPNHSRGPGGALACVMVPVFNLFYGIPSTFLRIGNSMRSLPTSSAQGRIVGNLAVPLTLIIWISNSITRYANKQEVPDERVVLLANALDVVLFSAFLVICLQIARGLRHALSSRIATAEAAAAAVGEEPDVEVAMTAEEQIAATAAGSENAESTFSLEKKPAE